MTESEGTALPAAAAAALADSRRRLTQRRVIDLKLHATARCR
ncbi:hypothetical protein [uncultured Jatrophihabitans sp.]